MALVRNSGVSVIAGCPQVESTLISMHYADPQEARVLKRGNVILGKKLNPQNQSNHGSDQFGGLKITFTVYI